VTVVAAPADIGAISIAAAVVIAANAVENLRMVGLPPDWLFARLRFAIRVWLGLPEPQTTVGRIYVNKIIDNRIVVRDDSS